MSRSWKEFMYFLLQSTIVLDLMGRYSNVNATEGTIGAIDTNSDKCERHKDMFKILETIVTGSRLNHVTVITDVHATGCVDLTYMKSVTYITSCTTWNQDIFWQSASHELTLVNFVIDCNITVRENIIKELLSARSLGSEEKRLLLPVYNIITTDLIELNFTLGLDVAAIHFVSIVRNDDSVPMDQASLDDGRSRHSSRKHLMNMASQYKIRKSESGSSWTTLATYENNQYIGISTLLRSALVNFEGMNLKVTHSLYTPFTTRKNGVYSGFCIDLLKSVANTLNFTYELIYSIDKKFGVKNSRGTWNGMMGMMDRKEVDMIVAGLTITYHREQVVDFTVPFYEETSAVVVRTNILESDIPWTYLFEPLTANLWLLVAGSVVVFSILGYIVEELGTGSKKQPMSPILHDESTDVHFSLTSSIWLLVCSYARQGADAIPLSGSGRMTMSAIWIFTLMIGWLYNANLTASLTTVYRKPPFNNLEELANDTEYTLMLNGGSVQRLLLEGAKRGIYASLWKKIEKTQADSLRSSTTDALRVMFSDDDTTKKYAVMGDLTSLKTKLARDYGSTCDWVYIPEMFFTSGLGIALPEGSPYKSMFDDAVFKALESGLSLRYKKKNFYPSNCHILKMGSTTEAKPISISHVKTFLVLTGGGIVFSSLVFLIESLVHKLMKSKRGNTATSLQK